jgi:hypothetical protein
VIVLESRLLTGIDGGGADDRCGFKRDYDLVPRMQSAGYGRQSLGCAESEKNTAASYLFPDSEHEVAVYHKNEAGSERAE